MVISILCQILPPLLWNKTASKKIKSIPPHKQSTPINKKMITTCLLVTLTNQKAHFTDRVNNSTLQIVQVLSGL